MANPLVSVIIPVFNGKNFLHDAVSSVLEQSYFDFEVIIVDDGSEDDKYVNQLVKEFDDSRLMSIRKENGGVSTALNYGIKHAKGKYFCWLSHDDKIPKRKLELQVECLEAQDSLLVVTFANWEHFDNQGKHLYYCNIQPEISTLKTSLGPVERQLLNFCTIMFPLDLFQKIGTFREDLKYVQDYEFLLRLAKFRVKWIYIPEILGSTRLHSAQDTRTKNVESEHYKLWSEIARDFVSSTEVLYSPKVQQELQEDYLEFAKSQNLKGAIDFLTEKLTS
jgi:glycosyltransferase involved in cell wall biosynthesis